MSVLALIISVLSAITLVVFAVTIMVWSWFRRQAKGFGYASVGHYLRAAPRSDEEKRQAVSLALQGVVICILGLLFPPFLLIGLFPLFFGARKVAWANMGLGLVDDADHTTT